MVEEWRPVVGYVGLYDVSNLGRVRSLVYRSPNNTGHPRVEPLILTAVPSHGYLTVDLCRDGRKAKRRIHRLELEAFVGPCPPEHEAAHYDGDRTNNSLDNLRWALHRDNYQDTVRYGAAIRGTRGTWIKV